MERVVILAADMTEQMQQDAKESTARAMEESGDHEVSTFSCRGATALAGLWLPMPHYSVGAAVVAVSFERRVVFITEPANSIHSETYNFHSETSI